MGDRELTDLANVLLTAAGAGLALACGYLVMKPATRTLKKWVGASLVALPGLLLGLMLAHPQLGVRSAYGGLTDALLGSSNPLEETFDVARPATGENTSSEIGGSADDAAGPSLAPSGGTVITSSPDSAEEPAVESVPGDPSSETPPPPSDTETPPPPSDTETPPPPSDTETPPPPSDTETPPPPSDTETPPPPSDTETPPPPSDTETPPPPSDTETPPPPPPPEPDPS